MKKTLTIWLLLTIALTFNSCRKPPKDTNYVGEWHGNYTIISISADGRRSYDYNDGFVTKNIAGRVKIKNGTLKICQGLSVKRLVLTKSRRLKL